MRVLGIDAAAAGPTGYGVVETDGRGCRVLSFGALRHARADSAAARLEKVHALLARLVEEYAPDAVALEAGFSALNVKTALRLAEVRGVVILAAEQKHVPVHSYAPREVKASVAGHGHAGKEQVQHMVGVLLGLRDTSAARGLGTDAADALAVALCHIQTTQAQERFRAATAPLPGNGARPGAGTAPRGAAHSRTRTPRIQNP